MNAGLRMKVVAITAVTACLAMSPALAETFDFEDGTLQGWLSSTTGGSGSNSVAPHNGSQMAYVQHTGDYTHSLSNDFSYGADRLLSFDMQAIAVPSLNTNAYAGVTVSFLSAFNVALGSFSLYNITNPASLGTHQYEVDNLQHQYTGTMATFATLAGLDSSAPISKISLSFTTFAQGYQFGCCGGYWQSTGSVWFDDVQIGVVPEPGARALFLMGLGALAFAARRVRVGKLLRRRAF